MKRTTSKLPLLAALLAAVLLLLPSAAAAATAKAIDASKPQRLELPDTLAIGPESVAFDGHGAGPYVSVSDGRILKYGGEGAGWTTFAYSPSYTKNGCDAQSSELPAVATEELLWPAAGPSVPQQLRQPLHHRRIHGADARRA